MGLGEISLGEMGLGEMGLGKMGQNQKVQPECFDCIGFTASAIFKEFFFD